jgi:hypothetical protein
MNTTITSLVSEVPQQLPQATKKKKHAQIRLQKQQTFFHASLAICTKKKTEKPTETLVYESAQRLQEKPLKNSIGSVFVAQGAYQIKSAIH